MRSNPVRAGAIRYSAPLSTPAAIMHARPPHKVAQIAPPPAPAVPAAPVVREFKTFAEYLRAVVAAANGEGVDRRLQRAPTGLSEGVPADGGFLVPQTWADDLIGSIYNTGQIAGRCDRKTTLRPIADVELAAVDETSRASGSRWGGVIAYWGAEASSQSSTFPKWRRVGFSGHKIIGIGYATGEMMADDALFEAGLREAFSQELAFALDECVLVGSGAGQPAGVVSAPCAISVAKETGQAAATIVAANVLNMHDRLVADCRPNACWFVNPDCDPQLRNLALVVGTAGAPLWSWNSDTSPYPRLLGLPAIPTEHNAALGTVGDIVLGDFSQYRIVDQAPKDAVSFDAAFVSDQIVFRMVYRVDGKSKYASAITPANSSTTRSPFITLATRA
jgi:HK97 family phage major capsid protein